MFVFLIYSAHFHNAFHFDDFHTAVLNPYIRDLHNIPRFFTDAQTFSVRPLNRVYRPLVSTTLAIDYWLGGGLDPFFFQISTFCWFLVQLVLMFMLFRKVYDLALPDAPNWITALVATAWYGVHPAMAETVNYIIQRGDVYSTLGPIAGILIYSAAPRLRKYGLYLVPVAAALLSKPPAIVFPALLFCYIWLFETDDLRKALFRSIPATVVTAAFAILAAVMNPPGYSGGAASAYAYRITQPLVALRYFRTFFMPGGLTADTDLAPVSSIWNGGAWAGWVFAVALMVIAFVCTKKRRFRPVAFGILWFLLALLPTSIYPLAEVENDHRMFFPFVGLVLAAPWPVALWIYRQETPRRFFRGGIAVICCFELLVLSLGTMQRNLTWRTEESLWRDVSIKSPRNARGLLNYAVSLREKGEPAKAVTLLKEAQKLKPNSGLVEFNLAMACDALKQDCAEEHFLRGLQLDPITSSGRLAYAKWLSDNRRRTEAIEQLLLLAKINPDFLLTHYHLMDIYAKQEAWQTVTNLAEYVLHRFPLENEAKAYRLMAAWDGGTAEVPSWKNADSLLRLSALYHDAGKFHASIRAAREALRMKPRFPEAYNNISAASRALGNWNDAIEAARQSLLLRPGFKSAEQNLAKAREGRRQL